MNGGLEKTKNRLKATIVINKAEISARGPGASEKNCMALLASLWEAAGILGKENTVLERSIFDKHWYGNSPFVRCAKVMEASGIIEIVKINDRGNPVSEIRLLKKEIPFSEGMKAKKYKPKPKVAKEKIVKGKRIVDFAPKKEVEKKARLEAAKTRVFATEKMPKEHIFTFVDLPNLWASHIRNSEGRPIVDLNLIEWEWFFDFIRERCHFGNHEFLRNFLWMGVYHLCTGDKLKRFGSVEQIPLYREIKKAGFDNIYFRKNKRDIDAPLASDMSFEIMKGFSEGKIKKDNIVTVVLVSGDGGYSTGIKKLKSFLLEQGILMQAILLSWNHERMGTAAEIKKVADKWIKVEDILERLCPSAYLAFRDLVEPKTTISKKEVVYI